MSAEYGVVVVGSFRECAAEKQLKWLADGRAHRVGLPGVGVAGPLQVALVAFLFSTSTSVRPVHAMAEAPARQGAQQAQEENSPFRKALGAVQVRLVHVCFKHQLSEPPFTI